MAIKDALSALRGSSWQSSWLPAGYVFSCKAYLHVEYAHNYLCSMSISEAVLVVPSEVC